jgi:hypothetical protein
MCIEHYYLETYISNFVSGCICFQVVLVTVRKGLGMIGRPDLLLAIKQINLLDKSDLIDHNNTTNLCTGMKGTEVPT